MLELPVTYGVEGILCECILGSSPTKRLRKIFPSDIPENCHNWWPDGQLSTGCPAGTSSLEIEHERFKHQYLWAAETLCHTERRLAFSCKANHKVTLSSRKNEQNQIFHYHKVTKEFKTQSRTSLVVQWLRICLLIQGTQTKTPHASGQLSPLRGNSNPVQPWRRRS